MEKYLGAIHFSLKTKKKVINLKLPLISLFLLQKILVKASAHGPLVFFHENFARPHVEKHCFNVMYFGKSTI